MACSTEERSWPLPGRKLHEAREMLPHDPLRWNDDEGVLNELADVIAGLVLRPLKRI
jgi:hypothetical protein